MQEVQFNKVLISLMNEKGTSIRQLAEVLGCTTQAISNYRLGKSMPNYETLVKLADYFGVSCDYLLTGVKLEDKQEHKELGLSGTAIEKIKQYKKDKYILNFLNEILSESEFYSYLLKIFQFFKNYNNKDKEVTLLEYMHCLGDIQDYERYFQKKIKNTVSNVVNVYGVIQKQHKPVPVSVE